MKPNMNKQKPRHRNSPPGKNGLSDKDASTMTLIALRQGSHQAYEEIYLHYYKPVHNFLHALTRSREAAEDITHDVFIGVWENRGRLDPGQGIRPYLYAVAKNLAMRYFRKKKNESNYLSYSDLYSTGSVATDDGLLAEEAGAIVVDAMSRMPRIRKRIFEMYYKEGLDYCQIAERLEMNKATVANHLTNAKNDIRKAL